MLLDARDTPPEGELNADICIVGGGVAGIALAREFIGSNLQITILESGGLQFDPETDMLSQGSSHQYASFSPYQQRRRQLGGSAHCWGINLGDDVSGVRLTPLDEIDFAARDCLPYSGWPISRADLEPFYQRAHQICKLGSLNYQGAAWEDCKHHQLPLGNRVQTSVFQFAERELFTRTYRNQVIQSPNICVCLYSNVLELEANETSQRVTRAKVSTLQGKQFWVKAKIFVLSMGGIENARLLLLSNNVQKTGLANQHDVVGRFYMDHLMVSGGQLTPANPNLFERATFYDIHLVNQTYITGKLALSANVLNQEQILNSATYLIPRHRTYHLRKRAIDSYRFLSRTFSNQQVPPDLARHCSNLLRGSYHLAYAAHRRFIVRRPFFHSDFCAAGWSEVPDKHQEFDLFQVEHLVELSPNPENRVVLTDERDCLGCRKVRVDYRLQDIDIYSIQRTQAILQAEFARSGLGKFEIEPGKLPYFLNSQTGASHHMGTTRMHHDPRQGVVNAHCQVHGIANLFIAGSSVFTTGSYANPTLTIIALALRLADTLKAHSQDTLGLDVPSGDQTVAC
jgi:choline dehydrogenase-like flavoprotein